MQRLIFLAVLALAVAVSMPVAASAGNGQHAAITITANSDFTAPGSATGCACVTAGNGTPGRPYVIGPWAITAPSEGSSGWAVKVDNTSGAITSSFAISGISANYTGVPFTDPVIVLADVNNPSGTTISNISANGDGRGAELDSSSHVTLDQLSFNKMTGNALFLNGSSHITLSNSKLKATADGQVPHNADGLYALNSAYLSIGGIPACPKAQACNTFDYDTGWGVYLQNTHDVTIDHASANADDTGAYVLDNAWNVTLGNSNAEGGGPICITLNGQKNAHRIPHRPARRPAARQRVTRQCDPRRPVRGQHRHWHRQRGKRILRQPMHQPQPAIQPRRGPDGQWQHLHQRVLLGNRHRQPAAPQPCK